jgi:hypothetical protein
MKVGVRFNGKVLRVDPTQPKVVHADRDTVGPHEEIELTKHDDNRFDARFLASNMQLSMNFEGKLETRPAGTDGAWETFFATDQPDGSSLLYRFEGTTLLPVLVIEGVQ